MTFRDQIRIGAFTGIVVGLVDATVSLVKTRQDALLLGVGCVGVIASVGLLLGVLQGLIGLALAPILEHSGLRAWLGRHATRDQTEPREPVVLLHRLALAALIAGGLALWLLARILTRFADITEPELVRRLTLLAVAVLGLLALCAGALLARTLRRPLFALDARIGLPWPKSRALRRTLWFALPVGTTAALLLVRYGIELGAWAWVPRLGLFLVAEVLCAALGWSPLRRLRPRGARIVLWASVALTGLGALIWLGRSARAAEVLDRTQVAKHGLVILRALTDVDRDGFSSLYGGRDCAPLRRSINPGAADLPGNGVDENCDGHDTPVTAALGTRLKRTFHGGLPTLGVKQRPYNIVWFISEATRADHTSLLGYPKPTTPYLELLARESMVFTHAYSQSSATMFSTQSMLSGRNPDSMIWKFERRKLQSTAAQVTLAERLKSVGYRTLMISDSYLRSRLPGLHRGFDRVQDLWLDGKRSPWFQRGAAVATSLAISLVEDDAQLPGKGQPFFLVVYMSDPHDPYEPHAEGFPDFGRGELARYDGEIAFTDRYLGFFVDYLRYQRPLLDKTILVFNADHGEDFREHGTRSHGYNVNRQGVHVPLLVRIPGLEAKRVEQPVALIDIVPTLLEALGIAPDGMQLDGQSLLISAFAPEALDPERPIFSSSPDQSTGAPGFLWRGVRAGKRSFQRDDANAGRDQLYDIEHDFAETHNLVDTPAEVDNAKRMRRFLDESLTGNMWKERLAN